MKTLNQKLLQKKGIFPFYHVAKGDSALSTRQLDIALMEIGFKLSHELFSYLSGLHSENNKKYSREILNAVSEQLGDHVKHNTYFKNFPKNIPSTIEFWFSQIIKLLFSGQCEYGRYQHSYEEMLTAHEEFKLKATEYKIIDLGEDPEHEYRQLYSDLAASPVPLNGNDRELLTSLYREGYDQDCTITVRENKAIINALKLESQDEIDVDTPVDILRIACQLSEGDVTLTENTRFKSFKRPIRRKLLDSLNKVDPNKVNDLFNYAENFKRLGERLHPGEFQSQFENACFFFDVARGNTKVKSWASQVFQALEKRNYYSAINILESKPGYLFRNIDKIARECDDSEFQCLLDAIDRKTRKVSARVLLGLYEHLLNRNEAVETRIFVNKRGTAHATLDDRPVIEKSRIKALHKVLFNAIAERVPSKRILFVDSALENIALPLSEKTKSEGYQVLPRGSVWKFENNDTLRFFIYWKQANYRTDYDLSAAFYDENFKFVSQVSWTNLKRKNIAYHSGDLTEAPNGATEFIDVRLDTLDRKIKFIIPSVNFYAGELYNKVEEAFFGFMMRDAADFGKPFEALSVQAKFALRGDKRICIPLVFAKEEIGFIAKWMDIYANGFDFYNTVEEHVNSTIALAKSIYKREYFTMGQFLNLYIEKAERTIIESDLKSINEPITYIGLENPGSLCKDSERFTLSNLKSLIPE